MGVNASLPEAARRRVRGGSRAIRLGNPSAMGVVPAAMGRKCLESLRALARFRAGVPQAVASCRPGSAVDSGRSIGADLSGGARHDSEAFGSGRVGSWRVR